MKTAIALFLLFASCTALATLPTQAPAAAVFLTSCNQIVVAVIIMPDGTTLAFDKDSEDSAEAVKELAARSKLPARVYELGCVPT